MYLIPCSYQLGSLFHVAQLCLSVTSWAAACQASLSFTTSWSLPKFMSIAWVMSSSHLILWCPLLPSVFPSIRLFQWVGCSCQVTRILELSSSVLPMNIQGWFSFKINWFDLLAVQGTLRCLPQHHSSKTSILWCSAFFMVQLSQLYVTTGKTRALTIRTFVGSVMSLLSTHCLDLS